MVERYVYVSSGNAYASLEEIGKNNAVLRLDTLNADVVASRENSNAAKVACENAVLAGLGSSRTEIAGEDAGPHGAGLTDSDERQLLAALT